MLKCSAPGCTTDENTQTDGKSLTLFSFPCYDDSLVKQWEEKSKVIKAPDKNLAELKLCELHFESDSFVSEDKNALAPGALPTIFEFNNKRKIKKEEEPHEPDDPLELPTKQRKSEEPEEPQIVANPPQSSQESEKPTENSAPNMIEKVENNLSTIVRGSSMLIKQIDMGKKVYRLTIKIDKVVSTKNLLNNSKALEKEQVDKKIAKLTSLDVKNVGVNKPCAKTGCKLIKTVLNSKPLFQCEICHKYYVIKETNDKKAEVSNWKCYVCNDILPDPDTLTIHLRKHFICDMCHAQCSTQISYDKHLRLHVSTDPLLPYKCHKCSSIFEVKAEVCAHYAEKHSKVVTQELRANNEKEKLKAGKLFRCDYCYVMFKNEETYKSHVELHMANDEFNCSLCSKRFQTAEHLATHQTKHLGGLKYTCRVCAKRFSSLETVQSHIKSHMDVKRKDNKCNICNKMFKNQNTLNRHLRGHLSRAHSCPKCQKTFINSTTLRIHLKTHSEAEPKNPPSKDLTVVKKHTCSLCPNTFDSRSKLYNHIMTHLEQMHGGVETVGNIVIDGLDQLLESDEDNLP